MLQFHFVTGRIQRRRQGKLGLLGCATVVRITSPFDYSIQGLISNGEIRGLFAMSGCAACVVRSY